MIDTIDVTCGRPTVKSHRPITVDRFVRGKVGGWKYEFATPGTRTSNKEATEAGFHHTRQGAPGQRQPQREKVTCPMCGLSLELHGPAFTRIFDGLAERDMSTVSLSALVATVT